MALVEQVAKRRGPLVGMGSTRYVREALCAWADLAASLPTRGDLMPAGYIEGADGDAAAILQEALIARAQGAVVTLIYERLHSGSTGLTVPATWQILEISPGVMVDTRRGRWVTVKIEVPASVTPEEIESRIPVESVYPGQGGTFASILRRYRLRPGYRQGKSLVTLHFQPPTWGAVLRRSPGKGLLLVAVTTREARAVLVAGGNGSKDTDYVQYDTWRTVDGAKVHLRWRPIAGRATIPEAGTLLKLSVVASNPDIDAILRLTKTTNGQAPPSPGAVAQTLRFRGARVLRELTAEPWYFTEWLFEYERGGWDKETKVQRQIERVYKQAVLDPATGAAISGRFQNVAAWEDVYAPYDAKILTPADWSVIDKMIGW